MGPLNIQPGLDGRNQSGWWVEFVEDHAPVFVSKLHWVGFDLDGTLSRTDPKLRCGPPYPLGEPVPAMIATVKSLLDNGISVKIFTARASEQTNISAIQDWTMRHGLGRLEVTNQKDYNLIRFFDDRAIPITWSKGT